MIMKSSIKPQESIHEQADLVHSPHSPESSFKTPISTLQEYCQKLGKTPQYDLTALEGRAHQPQFVYRCMVGDVVATGQGGSKKQAKHAAAEAILKALTADLIPENSDSSEQNKGDLAVVSTSSIPQEPDDTNPVGSLQELVVARGWRLPEYTLEHETGPAHKKKFIICCTVESFKEFGTGSAKKHAKRFAATNMYHKLMNLPPEAKESITSQSREAKSKTSFHELKNSLGEKLSFANSSINLQSDHRQILQDLGQSNNFEVIYRNINNLATNGTKQCLVELTTQPLSVFHGSGESFEETHNNAALNALQFLKIFSEENLETSNDLDC